MIGSGIKKLRESRNLTQMDLAKKLGVTRQALSMWESNKRELKATMLNKMAKAFRVSVDEILRFNRITFKDRKEGRNMKNGNKKSEFQFRAPEARNVVLTGDFTSWDQRAISMKKDKTGLWKAKVELKPGKYEYKFIVDGEWTTDPNNNQTIRNSLGSLNSVRILN